MNWFNKLIGRGEPEDFGGEDDMVITAPHRPSPEHPANELPSFRNPAGRISRRQGRSDVHDARALIRDAFTPSQPVNDRAMFAGRRALLERLIVAIEDQRLHFVLYGDRGIGKTSILHVLSNLATDAEYLVCYISCADRMTFHDFARRIAQRIPLLYHADYAPGSPEIEQGLHLADILPQDNIDVSVFGEQLGRLSTTRLIIMLDEFDRVEADEFRRSIAELIKNLSDKAAPAQLVIAGVAADLTELIAQIPSIRRNVIGVLVPNMADEEVDEMLAIAERRAGLTISPEARELIGLASLGLPYLVGLVAQHAALIATDRGQSLVEKSDVREAIQKARAELSGRIAARTLHAISDASRKDQLIQLSKLAHAALLGGGVLTAEMIPDELRPSAEAVERGDALLEPLPGDPLGRWRFVDDGASIFIWLSALCVE